MSGLYYPSPVAVSTFMESDLSITHLKAMRSGVRLNEVMQGMHIWHAVRADPPFIEQGQLGVALGETPDGFVVAILDNAGRLRPVVSDKTNWEMNRGSDGPRVFESLTDLKTAQTDTMEIEDGPSMLADYKDVNRILTELGATEVDINGEIVTFSYETDQGEFLGRIDASNNSWTIEEIDEFGEAALSSSGENIGELVKLLKLMRNPPENAY